MKERKSKTLTYKQAKFHLAGPVLRNQLEEALKTLDTIGARREPHGPEGESPIWTVIGEYRTEDQFLFGVLVRYAPGTNPVTVVDDDQAKSLTVEQMAVPATDEGKRRELIDSMLFFGAIDNHVVLMQSAAMRSVHLEAHLEWLLRKATVIEESNRLFLIDQLPKTSRDRIEKREVRELDIGGALLPVSAFLPGAEALASSAVDELKNAASQQAVPTALTSKEVANSSGVIAAIKSLLAPDQAAKLNMEALAGSNIEYTLKVRYRHATTKDGQRLMNTLGAALRHAEGIETTIKFEGGGHLRGDELRLSGSVRINTINGVPIPDDVYRAIRKWLLEKVTSGDVKGSSTD